MKLSFVMKLIYSFGSGVLRNIQSSLSYKYVNILLLKVILILIYLALLMKISNSCVSEAATENIKHCCSLVMYGLCGYNALYS